MSTTNGAIVHFEISVRDTAKAVAFYMSVFPDWKFDPFPGMDASEYMMIKTPRTAETGSGVDGAMQKMPEDFTGDKRQSQGATLMMWVDDIDSVQARVVASGGKVAMEKAQIEGAGWVAYMYDLDNNMFGLNQL